MKGVDLSSDKFRKTIVAPSGEVIRFGWEFYYTFGVITSANQSEFKLEYNSPIQHEMVTGLKIRRAGANALTANGNPIVNDAAFEASFLTLKQRNAEVLEQLPLVLIEQATLQGFWFDVKIPLVDMTQSLIKCSNLTALVADEEYELTIRYWNAIIQKKIA